MGEAPTSEKEANEEETKSCIPSLGQRGAAKLVAKEPTSIQREDLNSRRYKLGLDSQKKMSTLLWAWSQISWPPLSAYRQVGGHWGGGLHATLTFQSLLSHPNVESYSFKNKTDTQGGAAERLTNQ